MWDVFISHASEDKEEVARPLAQELQERGLKVWYDELSLEVGDSLRRSIDRGLAESRFGVVILSRSFFSKEWTQRELDGLTTREISSGKVILPVWHGVAQAEVAQFSPVLADRVAMRSERGIEALADDIARAVGIPTVPERFKRPSKADESKLERITSGRALTSLFSETHFAFLQHDEAQDEFEADLLGEFLQEVHDWGEIWDDLEVDKHVRTELHLTARIKELEAAGWTLFGVKQKGRREMRGMVGEWVWYVIAVLRGEPAGVLWSDDNVVVVRKP